MDFKVIGDRIRYYREQRGWSQEALSFEADLSRSTIGRLERGEITPTFACIKKIETALGLSEDTLLKPLDVPADNALSIREFEYNVPKEKIPTDVNLRIVVSVHLDEN